MPWNNQSGGGRRGGGGDGPWGQGPSGGPHQQPDLEELLKDKFQLSLGLRHRFDHTIMSFAVTENLQNLNNTPDIGFQLGIGWIPRLEE